MTLHISSNLDLPVDAATETFGILAKKGAGKSNAAVVMAEEMYDAGVPWVAIDPKGDWWGLRSSADGKGPGLPIVVFGGRHGDVPLEPTAGALIADLVLAERLTCVLDVSEFSKADVRRFLLAFADRLYRQADADPLHLFLEEAHEYLPQMVRGPEAELVGAWQRIVKQGRFKGLGCTLVTQRSASLNKDVLTQVDTLIVLRTTSPQDRAAVRAWVDVHADSAEMLDTLPSLDSGEAWVWSPEFLHVLQRIQFRRRRTFDSGATPKVGQARKAPATLADVDLAAIKEQMAATIEKAKAEDPKELRKQLGLRDRRIVELERQLAERPHVEPEVLEVVPAHVIDAAVTLGDILDRGRAALQETLAAVLGDLLGQATIIREGTSGGDHRPAVPRAGSAGDGARAVADRSRAGWPEERADPPARRQPDRPPVPRATTAAGDIRLGKGERKVLEVLAEYPEGRTYNELAFLAGYSAKASTLGVILANLRRGGLVEPGNQPVLPTAAGLEAAGGVRQRPTGQALLDQWLRHPRMGEGERKVLLALVDNYPTDLTNDELCDLTGYSPTASTMGVILSKLRKLGLVEKGARRVAPEFMESIR